MSDEISDHEMIDIEARIAAKAARERRKRAGFFSPRGCLCICAGDVADERCWVHGKEDAQ